jgi:hypothetical protein
MGRLGPDYVHGRWGWRSWSTLTARNFGPRRRRRAHPHRRGRFGFSLPSRADLMSRRAEWAGALRFGAGHLFVSLPRRQDRLRCR